MYEVITNKLNVYKLVKTTLNWCYYSDYSFVRVIVLTGGSGGSYVTVFVSLG